MLHRNDIYWKGILEDLFADFLRYFYPAAEELFDISRGFEFLDKELEQLFPSDDPEHPKFVDKLVKVFTKEGQEEWILVHIEVQGYKDDNFALRMFTYFYRIRDRYDKEVISIAIFTDSDNKFLPDEYTYAGRDGSTSVVFKFKTYKVIDQDPAALEANENPFATVILTVQLAIRKKNLTTDDFLNLTLDIVRQLYRKGFDRKKIDNLLVFIRAYANFGKPEINAKFDQAIDELNKKTRTMGIREQVLQVRAQEATRETKSVIVKNLILKTNHSLQEIADLAEVRINFVLEVKKALESE